VREAQEVEGLRAPVSILLAALRRLAAEAQHGRLARLDLQVEGRQSCGELRVKPPRVILPLEARHEVIGVPHQVSLTLTAPGVTLLEPQIQYIVQVDVAQHGRDYAAYNLA
jgi:hypothetical protein